MNSQVNRRSAKLARVLVTDQSRGYYRENLISRRDALEVLRVELPYAFSETKQSVKRVAHALHGTALVFGFEKVGEVARQAEEAGDEALETKLNDLIEVLDTVIAEDEAELVKILIIEPDQDNMSLLELGLSGSSRDIHTVATAAEAERLLEEEDFSIIIMALQLPDDDGRSVLMRLRSRSRTALVPIIVLSESGTPQIETESLALGANAFFEKPYDAAAVLSSISVWLQRRVSLESRDSLTGLLDRIGLAEIYERLASTQDFSEQPMAVAVLEIDYFTEIVETYGFPMGDEVLRRVSNLLARMLRDKDVLGQWGEKRFVVFFPNTRFAEAADVLDRALEVVRHEPFRTSNENAFNVALSAGVVEIGSHERTFKDAMSGALTYLRKARQAGGGRIITPRMEAATDKETILVIEDDETIASLLVYQLEKEGYSVIHYSDGAQAHEEAAQNNPDLILMDIRLPGMDGFELLERFRRMPSYSRIPVLMLTAMGSENDLVKGFDLGADDYVLKPFSPVELAARLKRLLKRSKEERTGSNNRWAA